MTIEQVAAICHEANRALCESVGDYSQPAWKDAPDWQKKSAFEGVENHLKHPDASAGQTHVIWMTEKLEAGWKYGPVKNAETKEHPSLVPFEELPEHEQAKDHLFQAVVQSLSPFVKP